MNRLLKHIFLWTLIAFSLPGIAGGKYARPEVLTPQYDFKQLPLYFDSINEIDSAYTLIKSNPAKSLEFIEKVLSSTSNSLLKAESFYILTLININLKNYDEALANNNAAISYLPRRNSNLLYLVSKPQAYIHELNNQNELALKAYSNYLIQAQQKLDTLGIIYANSGKARILQRQNKLKKARKLHNEVQELQEVCSDNSGLALTANNLGEIASWENNNEEAVKQFNKAKLNSTSKSTFYSSYNSNIRSALKSDDNVDALIDFQVQEVQVQKASNDTAAILKENLELSNIYIDNGKWNDAIQSIEGNISLAQDANDYEQLSEGYRNLSRVYKETGETDKALKSLEKYTITIDSLNSKKEKLLAEKLAFNMAINEKQNRIAELSRTAELNEQKIKVYAKNEELQKETIRQQSLINYALIAILIILIATSILVFRSSRQKKIANQLLALKSLRTQMNPHFIFNALNSVNGFIAANDERMANKYLADFSKLMRAVLENSKSDLVTLESELSIIKLYLHLEHFRFKEKFDYEFNIDESIIADEVEIPPMLVQPYIENSVWHGLRYKKSKGKLKVECIKKDNAVIFLIEDDGIGREKSQVIKTQNQKTEKSTGLKNIAERLAIINNLNNTNIQVEINNLDDSKEDCGTKVSIKIPTS